MLDTNGNVCNSSAKRFEMEHGSRPLSTSAKTSTHEHSSSQEDHESLEDLRSQSSRMMQSHVDKISVARTQKICNGDSIVRDFALHDRSNFSIEQAMSVLISQTGDRWFSESPYIW